MRKQRRPLTQPLGHPERLPGGGDVIAKIRRVSRSERGRVIKLGGHGAQKECSWQRKQQVQRLGEEEESTSFQKLN